MMSRVFSACSNIVLLYRKVQYRCWLFFGGRRTEDGFRVLSESILENRKLINDLRATQRQLENRVWELEGHTLQETVTKIEKDIASWAAAVEDVGTKR